MRKISIFIAAALFLLASPSLFADKVDYLSVVNVDVDLVHLLIASDTLDIGSGAMVDFNTGIVLWHIGARVQYLNAFSLAGEAGLGLVFYATYETNAPYTQVIPLGSWTVGDTRYTRYERIEGTCPAAWLNVVEAGVKPQYINNEGYDWSTNFSDVIFYGGYRFVSFYQEIAPVEEIEFTLHGLVGIVNRTNVDGGTTTVDTGRAAYGVEAGLKWQFFLVDVAYYDNLFYMDFAFRFPITIM